MLVVVMLAVVDMQASMQPSMPNSQEMPYFKKHQKNRGENAKVALHEGSFSDVLVVQGPPS